MQVLSQAFIYGNLETFKDNIWESYSLYLEIFTLKNKNSVWNLKFLSS